MPRQKLKEIPETEGIYLTFEAAKKVTGIDISTMRSWRSKQPGNGFPSIRVEGRVLINRVEFFRWLELVAVEVAQVRRITFTSESKVRGNGMPRASILQGQVYR